jgi:hypothetical protein
VPKLKSSAKRSYQPCISCSTAAAAAVIINCVSNNIHCIVTAIQIRGWRTAASYPY